MESGSERDNGEQSEVDYLSPEPRQLAFPSGSAQHQVVDLS